MKTYGFDTQYTKIYYITSIDMNNDHLFISSNIILSQ